MNREDIIRMAQECQLIGMRPHLDGIYQESLERFATLVAKHTLANIDPSKFMSWQEGYSAGRDAATRDFLEHLRHLHDSYSLQSNPENLRARGQE